MSVATMGRIVLRPKASFTGLKVFAATMLADRDQLGERVTEWMAEHPGVAVTEIVQTQSSDARFHCLTLTVFYCEQMPTPDRHD